MPDNTITEQYWRLPPISRTLATWMFVSSVGLYFGFIPSQWLGWHASYILRFPPQIWRLVTGFLITGPQLGLLFDTYFFYKAASDLETGHPRLRRKEDFIWYLICVCSFIARFVSTAVTVPEYEEDHPCTSLRSIIRKQDWWGILDYFVAIMPFFALTRGLIVALTYTASQQQQGLQVNYMFVPLPAPLMPYAMIGVSLLFPGGIQDFFLGLYGLVAAHLYEFLTRIYPQLGGGPNILKTPKFMTSLVRAVEGRIIQAISRPGAPAASDFAGGRSTGVESGPLPDAWRTRGSGHRLG
ncbi:Der1-like protein [Cordyceps militaris]|uniref:Derlin n=1 Tax=Cordyceps militaris TaxID=73501 RepID=A0A2H4SIP6_CORMI|nr:Der1-like protein [Cordyceps militaris]